MYIQTQRSSDTFQCRVTIVQCSSQVMCLMFTCIYIYCFLKNLLSNNTNLCESKGLRKRKRWITLPSTRLSHHEYLIIIREKKNTQRKMIIFSFYLFQTDSLSLSDENYLDRAIKKQQSRGYNRCLYDALLMYTRLEQKQDTNHIMLLKKKLSNCISTRTLGKLIIVQQVVCCIFSFACFLT